MKAELWETLVTQLSQSNPHTQNKVWRPKETNSSVRRRKSSSFGCPVADSSLKCDTKDWALIKNKVMDLLFELDQQKLMLEATCMCHFCHFFNNSKHSLKCFKAQFTVHHFITSNISILSTWRNIPTDTTFPQVIQALIPVTF